MERMPEFRRERRVETETVREPVDAQWQRRVAVGGGGQPPERPRRPEVTFEEDSERARLIRALQQLIGDPGVPPTEDGRLQQLERILALEPQFDPEGRLRYLLTSGLAVELITGFQRDHHDIDLVIMDEHESNRWLLIGTDNVTPGQYWADMKFEPDYLQRTRRREFTRRNKPSPRVEVVHPAIILVQKSSNAFGRPPRERDSHDVSAIVRHWKKVESFISDWNPIIRHSLDALPPQQLQISLSRVRDAIRNN